jgi:hypothetical protein
MNKYRKTSPDGLVMEVARMFRMKQEIMQSYVLLFEGNFRLTRIEKVSNVDLVGLQHLCKYLGELVGSYERLGAWKGTDAIIRPTYLDEIYDLATTLILLTLTLSKDIELKKHKP